MFARSVVVVCVLALGMSLSGTAAWAEGEGQESLDRATQLRLNAKTLADLEEILKLCEESLQKGLDEGNKKFAQQMLTSTLYQRASKLVEPIFERQPADPRWPVLRQLAVKDLERLLAVDPAQADSQFLYARLMSLPGGDREKATQAADAALKLFADDKENTARTLVVRGDLREKPADRIADYTAALAAHDRCKEAYRARGLALLSDKKFAEAEADFSKLLLLQDRDLAGLEGLIEVQLQQKKFDKALEVADRVVRLLPENSGSFVQRARIHSLLGDNAKSLTDLNEAVRMEPRDARALLFRASLRQSQGESELALADVNRVVELAPKLPAALLMRSSLAMDAKRFDEAITDLQTLSEADPTNVAWQLQLAAAYGAAGRSQRGHAIVEKLLAADPKNWLTLRARGDLYLNTGKQREALADYVEAAKIQPDNPGILNNLAWLLATSPDDTLRSADRAIALATKACELTEHKQAHIVSTLAAAYAEKGDWESALKWSTKAVELGGRDFAQLKDELASYQQKKPWREKKVVEEKPEPSAKPDDLLPNK